MALLRNLGTVSFFTLMSRVLGFLRDMLLLPLLGTTVGDPWFAAFRLPNMFRRIFAEGAFNAAFVPLFGRELEEHGPEAAERFANRTFSWLVLVLGIGTVFITFCMRWAMAAIAFGFLVPDTPDWSFTWEWFWEMVRYPHGTETFELSIAYGRIMFSYLLFMALTAQLSGVLNTLRIFAMPAFAPVLLNICLLIGLIAIIPAFGLQHDLPRCGHVVSWCVFVSGIIQMGALFVTCRIKGMKIHLIPPVRTARIQRLFILMGPGIASASIQQINLLIGTQISSLQEGAVTILYSAERIYQFPLGMIGVAFGVVLLPEITRRLRGKDEGGAKRTLANGVEFSLLLTVPAAVAMLVIAYPIISVLFERDNFLHQDAVITAKCLAAFAIGLPAYVLVKVLQPGYFAQENTKSPMIMMIITLTVNTVLSVILFVGLKMGPVGIAIATSVAGWVNVFLLSWGLRSFLSLKPGAISRIFRMVAASAVMGFLVWAMYFYIAKPWFAGGMAIRFMTLGLLVGVGVAVYLGLALSLKATTLAEFKKGLKRG